MATGRVPTTANSPLTAKGDLFGYSTTQARVAVGNDGETLVADSSATTGLRWQGDYAAGKNAIINGDFAINQRAFTTTSTDATFGFDRWLLGLSGGTGTYTAQTFTLGTAPVAGYESKNFARLAVTTGNDYCRLQQRIENVRTFAGQTVTISFWAKGTNPTTLGSLNVTAIQNFGSGGSPSSSVITNGGSFTLTANWTRYSLTVAIPSISGKTIGTSGGDNLDIGFGQGSNTSTDSWTLDLWGVQVEAGSVATAFQTATGTIQGELAACQRYYYRTTSALNTFTPMYPQIFAYSTTNAVGTARLPQRMRTKPSAIDFSSVTANEITTGGSVGVATISLGQGGDDFQELLFTGLSGMTIYRPYAVLANNTTSAFLGLSAEL